MRPNSSTGREEEEDEEDEEEGKGVEEEEEDEVEAFTKDVCGLLSKEATNYSYT